MDTIDRIYSFAIIIVVCILISVLLFSNHVIEPVAVVALEVSYLDNTNGTLSYNGSIDITGNYFINGSNVFNASMPNLWRINQNNSYIEPIASEFNRTVRVNDLIIQNGSSLFIGGIAQSKISSESLFFEVPNATIITTVVNSDFFVRYNRTGTSFLSNINFNNEVNSSANTGASDVYGNGMIMQKFNENYDDPFLGALVSLRGNMRMMTTSSNGNTSFGQTLTEGNNTITLGFYNDIFITEDAVLQGYGDETDVIVMNASHIDLNKETDIEENLYFNHLNSSEIPINRTNYTAMYCKDNDKCYFKRSNGLERRIVDATGGSFHFDEEVYFNTSTVVFEHSDYTGVGNAYVCFDATGEIFRSATACN